MKRPQQKAARTPSRAARWMKRLRTKYLRLLGKEQLRLDPESAGTSLSTPYLGYGD